MSKSKMSEVPTADASPRGKGGVAPVDGEDGEVIVVDPKRKKTDAATPQVWPPRSLAAIDTYLRYMDSDLEDMWTSIEALQTRVEKLERHDHERDIGDHNTIEFIKTTGDLNNKMTDMICKNKRELITVRDNLGNDLKRLSERLSALEATDASRSMDEAAATGGVAIPAQVAYVPLGQRKRNNKPM